MIEFETTWYNLHSIITTNSLRYDVVNVMEADKWQPLRELTDYNWNHATKRHETGYIWYRVLNGTLERVEHYDEVHVRLACRLVPITDEPDPYKTPSPDSMPPYEEDEDQAAERDYAYLEFDDGEYDAVEMPEHVKQKLISGGYGKSPRAMEVAQAIWKDRHQWSDKFGKQTSSADGQPPAGQPDNLPTDVDLKRRVVFIGDTAIDMRTVTGLGWLDGSDGFTLTKVRVSNQVGLRTQTNWMSGHTFLAKLLHRADSELYARAARVMVRKDEIPF